MNALKLFLLRGSSSDGYGTDGSGSGGRLLQEPGEHRVRLDDFPSNLHQARFDTFPKLFSVGREMLTKKGKKLRSNFPVFSVPSIHKQ